MKRLLFYRLLLVLFLLITIFTSCSKPLTKFDRIAKSRSYNESVYLYGNNVAVIIEIGNYVNKESRTNNEVLNDVRTKINNSMLKYNYNVIFYYNKDSDGLEYYNNILYIKYHEEYEKKTEIVNVTEKVIKPPSKAEIILKDIVGIFGEEYRKANIDDLKKTGLQYMPPIYNRPPETETIYSYDVTTKTTTLDTYDTYFDCKMVIVRNGFSRPILSKNPDDVARVFKDENDKYK